MSPPTNKAELATAPVVDLAKVRLDYEGFRQLARNPHLSRDEKIGFPDSYRAGYEDAILNDIAAKLPALYQPGSVLVDIGCGCGGLVHALLTRPELEKSTTVLVDSPEMLAGINSARPVRKVEGFFPENLQAVQQAAPEGADSLLCYSVLQYIFLDTNLFSFLDAVIAVLKPGGRALIGDIPNISKRKRFFASAEGIAFHQQFMKTTDKPSVFWNQPEPEAIDDAVLAGLIQRAQLAGCDAYLLPQDTSLPMANRRDDLLIRKY